MKILLYSDLHISKTSSILPLNFSSSKYSYRQQMIIDTGKYLAGLVEKFNPDIIINLGDTFDVHTLTSYDISTASEFFNCFSKFKIPHIVLVGNHEMLNHRFNAVELLNNIENITVISNPTTCYDFDNSFAFLPYCNYKDILEFPKGKFLFSHQDIQGSYIRSDIKLPDGIDTSVLKENYALVFNGHIHKPSILKNVVNVGSVTTHSFADDEDSVPQCYIFDTETLDMQTFKPTCCPLFRKIYVETIQDLNDRLNSLDKSYKYVLNCNCPYEIKDLVKKTLEDSELVVNYKITIKIVKDSVDNKEKQDIILQQSNIDITNSFKEFVDLADLKYPKNLYLEVIEAVKGCDSN